MDVLIAGFGTVGQGVAEAIQRKNDLLSERFQDRVRIIGVFDSRSYEISKEGILPSKLLAQKALDGAVGKNKLDREPIDLIQTLSYDTLIDVTPTNIVDAEPSLGYMRTALRSGRNVITSNKGPLALKFREISKLAESNHVQMRYEASVGGAMPIINLSRELLLSEKIYSLRGILNGTCNFILNRMKDEGLPFEQALREAQEMGIAEKDPSYDIDGVDSACKLAILANAIFGMEVTYSDIMRIGIRSISEESIALAAEQKKVVRLIGEIGENKLEVSPRLIPVGHPLAIGGTLNIVQLLTDMAGEITVAGRGAGRMETASAVMSDIVAIMKDNKARDACRI